MTSSVSHIVVDEHFFTTLFQFIEICGHLSMHSSRKVLSQHFNWVKSGLWLGHHETSILFFFSHSVVDLLVCLGSLSCCTTQFWPSRSCWTDGITFNSRILWYAEEFVVNSMTAKCPGLVAAKQAQIITLNHCGWQMVWEVSVSYTHLTLPTKA